MFARHVLVVFSFFIAIDEILCQKDSCVTPDRSKGVCVEISACPLIQTLLNNSPRPLPSDVVTTLNRHTCLFRNLKPPKVCCKDGEKNSFTTEKNNRRNNPEDGNKSNNPKDVSNHKNLNLLPLDTCGEIVEDKISHGTKTSLFELPWMARLQYNDSGNLQFFCGGSLISDRYVLTAAHCVAKLRSTIKLVAVRLGEHDTRTDIDCEIRGNQKVCAPPVQDIPVEEAFAHQLYGKLPKFSNDIAIVRLARAAIIAENVRPICLPTSTSAQNIVLKRVSIAGWGTTENQRSSPVLLQAFLPMVANDICQRKLKMIQHSIEIIESQMCAGGETGIDGCEGDSGGPLIYLANVNGVRMVQFGVVSFGASGCTGMHNNPGVFSNVSFYMPWILDHMKP